MSKKITIYIADQVQARVGPATSARVNSALDRYAEILDRTPVDHLFSEFEWSALRNLLNGVLSEPAGVIAGSLAQAWADIGPAELGELWPVHGPAMGAKLRLLSYVEEVAVIEAVESWWIDHG